jgi:hypothetical protein
MVQDVLSGRSVDWEDASRAALAGGYAAAPFGLAGRKYSDGLPIAKKGKLGEDLGQIRSIANGERPLPGQPRYYPNNGRRYTVVDHMTEGGLRTEQKFGRSVRKLRPAQQAAYDELGDGYRVDHFLPRDVGVAVAYPFGQIGYHEFLADDPT